MSDEELILKIREGKVEKGESSTRDGFKPSAPPNLVIPQPVVVPPPPKENK